MADKGKDNKLSDKDIFSADRQDPLDTEQMLYLGEAIRRQQEELLKPKTALPDLNQIPHLWWGLQRHSF